MPIYRGTNHLMIYVGNKNAEVKFRTELSGLLLSRFGNPPYDSDTISNALSYCLDYFVGHFERICSHEKSYTFYKYVFWFHEQSTELVQLSRDKEVWNEDINEQYVLKYRRILKFIIECGCDVKMQTGEEVEELFRVRFELLLDDLLYLGDMIFSCVEFYAEQRMVDDVADISFDENGLFHFSRRHHYEFIFKHIINEFNDSYSKQVVDEFGIEDFSAYLKKCMGFEFIQANTVVVAIQEELGMKDGETVAVNWTALALNMNHFFDIPVDKAETFFSGLKLHAGNKMSLKELACKPYNLNRFLYRPIVIWTIDNEEYAVFGRQTWTETIIQLITNAFPWGKAPVEWMKDPCFKNYIHEKENEHDRWLDDEAEKKIILTSCHYDRNVKRLLNGINIDVLGLGEVDFIIVSPAVKKVFIADCKHLLSRFDMVNQKNDFNAFVVGSRKTKPYNETMRRKVEWFSKNKKALAEHFTLKYGVKVSVEEYDVEGVFFVNSPTFYMYNAEFRIYTVDRVPEVLNGVYHNPEFTILIDEENWVKTIHVKYPFFKKPEYIYYDENVDDEANIS